MRRIRPDFQKAKLRATTPKVQEEHVGTLDIEISDVVDRLKSPSDGLEQIRVVRNLLAQATAPAPTDAVAAAFEGRATPKRRDRINAVLETLVETGLARNGGSQGEARYFLPR